MRFVCLSDRKGAVRYAKNIVQRWGLVSINKLDLRSFIKSKCLFSIEATSDYSVCGCVFISTHRNILNIEIFSLAPQAYTPQLHHDLIRFAMSMHPSQTILRVVVPKPQIQLIIDFRNVGMVITKIYPTSSILGGFLPLVQSGVHICRQ